MGRIWIIVFDMLFRSILNQTFHLRKAILQVIFDICFTRPGNNILSYLHYSCSMKSSKRLLVPVEYKSKLRLRFLSLLILKLLSAIFHQIFISHQMVALQKLWKMLFISSKKVFSLSRYSNFCISVVPSFSPCQPLF